MKNRFKASMHIICLLILVFCQNLIAASYELGPLKSYFKVEDIKIYGNKKVEDEAILEKLSAAPGMNVDNYVIRKDIESIYRLKFFETVQAHRKTIKGKETLIYKVIEKPIIRRIVLVGNDELDDDDLQAQIKSKEFSILDVNTVKNDVTSLQKYYEEKGFYLANVSYRLKKINKENTELQFIINEAQKVVVKKITFLGNRSLSDEELKGIMETREEGLFSGLSGSGSFKEFSFQTDIERMKYFYKTKGFLQVNIGSPEITVSEDKKWVFVSIKITEGPLFTVNDIYFDGDLLFPEDELLEKISLKSNDTYSEEKLRRDIQLLTEKYQDEGYAFANVLRTLNVVPGENKVDIQFSFEKGKIAYFGKISVKGNTKTRDKVIRRELKVREGMKFSGSAMRESKNNVNRLGFFENGSVIFNTVSRKNRDDVLDLEISVKERNTGQITLGAGYSTTTKFFVQASIAQNNFRGLGQNLSLSLSLSDTNKTYSLGFTEPYLFDTKWTAGGDIFRIQNEGSRSFRQKIKGFDLRVGYPIFDYTRVFMTYKFEDTVLENVEDPTIRENIELENGVASSVEVSLVKDKRNNKFEPSAGYYLSLSTEYAGLGGDKRWAKFEIDGRYYKRLFGDFVLRSRVNAAKLTRVGDTRIPRTEKFSLGGSRNMRGYGLEAIGETALLEDSQGVVRRFNVGGLFSLYSTVEIEHPLVREAGLKWVVFYDAGNVYQRRIGETYSPGTGGNYSLRQDYGFGLRWFSPIGVLRFEFGYPLNAKEGDDSSQFHFDIGQLF